MKTPRKTITVTHSWEGADIRVRKSDVNELHPDVAKIAADQLARRIYGQRGACLTCRIDSWTDDGSSATYQASIGEPAYGGGYNVRNVWLYL